MDYMKFQINKILCKYFVSTIEDNKKCEIWSKVPMKLLWVWMELFLQCDLVESTQMGWKEE